MTENQRRKRLMPHRRLIQMKLYVATILISLNMCSCKPSMKQMFMTAEDYFNEGKYSKSIDIYNQILHQDSLNQLAFFERGRCNCSLGRNKEAIADFNKVISLQPPSNGQVEFRWNRDSPFAPEKDKCKVYAEEAIFERAVAEYEIDSARKAFRDFQTCFDIGYEKTVCKRYLGCLYIVYQKKDKGCSMLKEAMLEGDTTSYALLHKYCY